MWSRFLDQGLEIPCIGTATIATVANTKAPKKLE